MTASGIATLTSTGIMTAPKLGDILDYRVSITGDASTISIGAGQATIEVPGSTTPQPIAVSGGPWVFNLLDFETVGPPVVTGVLTKPFAQDPADIHHWQAQI